MFFVSRSADEKIYCRGHALSPHFPQQSFDNTFIGAEWKCFAIRLCDKHNFTVRKTLCAYAFKGTPRHCKQRLLEPRFSLLFAASCAPSRFPLPRKFNPFRPYGKTCTASFRGDARKSAVLLRFIHNNCKAVRRMRAVIFFFVISKSNQWWSARRFRSQKRGFAALYLQ